MAGTMRPGYMPPPPAPPLVTIVLDLGNSCLCYGCRQKTCRVLNRLQGVREHCCNLETNQIKLTGTVNPDIVIRNISKIKKHAKVFDVIHHPPSPGTMQQPRPPAPQPCCGGPQGPPPPPPSHHAPPPQGPPPSSSYCDCIHGPPPSAAQPPRQSVHIHVTEQGKSSSCHCPPPPPRPNCGNGPLPPPMQPLYCRESPSSSACHCPSPRHPPPPPPNYHQPPPSSACHCPPPCHPPPPLPDHHHQPPPPHHNAAVAHRPPAPNNPANYLDNFLHGPSSPLIPSTDSPTGVLNQLAKIPNLKNVELIKKKGIKFRFQDGQVKSCHPTSYMEVRPGYDRAALPQPHQQPPPYISPFSDENPNGPCTIS